MGKKFITSALPYVNNQPHLGNIVGSVLGADVYHRYCKKCGDDSILICGTDEYGTATEMEAMKQGVHPRDIVEKNRKLHKQVYDWLNLEFDQFGKTDCEEHIKMTQEVFMKSYENGYFEGQPVSQFYCNKCDQFLADRYVEGECCHCGYSSARGDQCDKCGKCLKAEELKAPKCVLCLGTPVLRETKHLFLRLDRLQEQIKGYFETRKKNWSVNAQHIYEEWIKKDIHPRCMTRLLKYRWGVPVPLEGYEDKVFYVWFDAPIGYLTFLSQAKPDWREWVADAQFVQFMGKDNVPFHAIIFPAMLMSAIGGRGAAGEQGGAVHDMNGEGRKADKSTYPIVDVINSTEYLQFNQEKFSKSRGVGIFGMDLVTRDLGSPDVWRFYLMRKRPETKDSDFSTEDFITQVNSDLIANIGNFCNRILKYINKALGGKVEISALDGEDERFVAEIDALYKEYKRLMDRILLRDALGKLLEITSRGNKYLQDLQQNREKMGHGFAMCYSLVVLAGHMLEPFLPGAASRLFSMCKSTGTLFPERFDIIKSAVIEKNIVVLFTPFTDAQLANLRSYTTKADSNQ